MGVGRTRESAPCPLLPPFRRHPSRSRGPCLVLTRTLTLARLHSPREPPRHPRGRMGVGVRLGVEMRVGMGMGVGRTRESAPCPLLPPFRRHPSRSRPPCRVLTQTLSLARLHSPRQPPRHPGMRLHPHPLHHPHWHPHPHLHPGEGMARVRMQVRMRARVRVRVQVQVPVQVRVRVPVGVGVMMMIMGMMRMMRMMKRMARPRPQPTRKRRRRFWRRPPLGGRCWVGRRERSGRGGQSGSCGAAPFGGRGCKWGTSVPSPTTLIGCRVRWTR